jgi:CheY-like chemotaxis protein
MADDRGDGRQPPRNWWQSEPITSERLQASRQVLAGVLREARALRATARERARHEGPSHPDPCLARCVLVVDDDPDQRELYSLALAADGFRVSEACDGADGLAKARAQKPDIVVTDFSMPTMDGGELAKRLATDEVTCATPVVMLTAFADGVPREIRLACAAFLAKPCMPEELTQIVALVIAARAPARG